MKNIFRVVLLTPNFSSKINVLYKSKGKSKIPSITIWKAKNQNKGPYSFSGLNLIKGKYIHNFFETKY